MDTLVRTPLTTLKRRPARGSWDRALIHSILDEGLVCHIGFTVNDQPFVTPTTYARIGDRLYIHGAIASRMLRNLATGVPMCFTVTLLDGLVLARSAFHHSMNYRSVMVFGMGIEVSDPAERYRAFEAVVNHILPGRFNATRQPDEQEIKATSVIGLDITEASAKVRSGPVSDAEEDYDLPYWAGVLPMKLMPQSPIPDDRLAPGIAVPPEVTTLSQSAINRCFEVLQRHESRRRRRTAASASAARHRSRLGIDPELRVVNAGPAHAAGAADSASCPRSARQAETRGRTCRDRRRAETAS